METIKENSLNDLEDIPVKNEKFLHPSEHSIQSLRESIHMLLEEKEDENEIKQNLEEDEKENENLQNKNIDKRTKKVVSVINSFYNVIHILIAFFVAHFLGSYGWHISWVILFAIIMARIHNSFTSVLYKEKYLKFQKKQSKKNTKIGPIKEEKTEWVNDFLKCYYPNIVNSHMVMEMARSWLHNFVSGQMDLYKPPMVKSAEVSSFEFGDTPPEIKYIRAYKKENPDEYEMDIDIFYGGEMKIDMKIFSKLGTVPVSIHDFRINCQMKIEVGFWDKFPYMRYLRIAFRHLRKDWLNFDIKALVEIFNIEFIRGWINSAIDAGIKGAMHLPHKIEVRWDLDTQQDFKELKESEFDPNGKYTSSVTINIEQAKNLKMPNVNFPIDAYCKIQAGKYWVTTSTIKNYHPSWREQFVIPIDNRIPLEEQTVDITFYDKGKNSDTECGHLKVQVKKLNPNSSVHGWFRINGFSNQAEVQLFLDYDPNYIHSN